jgi:hypothetical protein
MKKGCLITIIVIPIIFLIGIRVLIWEHSRVKGWGIGVKSVEWLPKQASDITFVSAGIKSAEFQIDQESIIKWCDSIQKPLKPVTEGQLAGIYRTIWVLERRGLTPHGYFNNSSTSGEIIKTFRRGDLFYQHRWSNGGGYVIGYDVENERGYYHYSRN